MKEMMRRSKRMKMMKMLKNMMEKMKNKRVANQRMSVMKIAKRQKVTVCTKVKTMMRRKKMSNPMKMIACKMRKTITMKEMAKILMKITSF